MRASRVTAAILSVGLLSFAYGQVVPGFSVSDYANVNAPIEMAFGPSGVLYTGRSLQYSGGTTTGATLIHQIGIGGAPVLEYGASTIYDPDSVLFDASGTFGGVAGSVLVAGIAPGGTMGQVSAVLPDQSVVSVFGPSADLFNPNAMELDSTGRLLIADNDGEVYASTGATPTLLFTIPAANGSLAIDAADRIYTAGVDGVIRIHDASGALIDGSFVSGLSSGMSAPIAIGQGGIFGTDLFAVDRGTGELLRVDSAGTVTTIGSGFGDGDRITSDLAFGPDGALYASIADEGRVLRIIPEPASLALLLTGALVLLRRKQR